MLEYHKKGEIPALTGLRGAAALLVVISHYWHWTALTPVAGLPELTARWLLSTSAVGMAIFFTLSGYVIALNYAAWDWGNRPAFNLVRLFFYRFARLYPAFLVFAILCILRWPALHDLSDWNVQSYVLPHLLLWQTWWPVKFGGALASDDYFHVSWSLSVECGLYLAFALAAVVLAAFPSSRRKPLVAGVAMSLFAVALLHVVWLARSAIKPDDWTESDLAKWFFLISPYGVSLQFGTGVAAYFLGRRLRSPQIARFASEAGFLGLVVVYAASCLTSDTSAFLQSLLMSLVTGLILVGCRAGSFANQLLSGRAIVYVGTISYSVYLFHFITPPLGVHAIFFKDYTDTAALYHGVNFLAALALTLFFAAGVYVMVEVPGRRGIRAAADRILGIRPRQLKVETGAPAE